MSRLRANRSMPASTVIPTLACTDVTEAADWLCAVFGFTVRLRIGNHRVQMNVGDGAVVLTKLRGLDLPQTGAVMVRVGDVDRLNARVRAADVVCAPPEDFPYGERQFTVTDLAGNSWMFSQTIADVAPEDWGGESGRL